MNNVPMDTPVGQEMTNLKQISQAEKNSYAKMRISGRREGMIEPNQASRVHDERYVQYKSFQDAYQMPFRFGRLYEEPSSYRKMSQYKRPKDQTREGDWWIAGIPVIPHSQIINEQPVTNLFDPSVIELKDINKVQPEPYGNIQAKNKFIQSSIRQMDTVNTHALIHGITPYQNSLMKQLIWERRNSLPSYKFEAEYNEKFHGITTKKHTLADFEKKGKRAYKGPEKMMKPAIKKRGLY